jgi:arylsulfatase A-like enzyme
MRDYLSTARSLDRNIGELLDYLDQTGLSKNTVVIYASDQGFYLGEHGWFDKRFIYEESLKTPFVIKYPGTIKAGTQVRQVVSNVDWAPTLLDIAGVEPTAGMQGKSFFSLLKNPKKSWDNNAYYHYYEYPQPHRVAPHFGLRTEQFTLAKFYGPQDSWELYDIKKDPQNMKNLYGDKAYAAIIKKLKATLKEKMNEYQDTEALELLEKEPK